MGRCFWRGSGKGWFPHCKRTTWSSWTIWPRTRCRASARPSKLRVPAPVSAALFARFQPHRKHVEQDQANPPQPGPAYPGRTGPGRSNGLQRHLHRRLPRLLFTRSLRYMICGNTLMEPTPSNNLRHHDPFPRPLLFPEMVDGTNKFQRPAK